MGLSYIYAAFGSVPGAGDRRNADKGLQLRRKAAQLIDGVIDRFADVVERPAGLDPGAGRGKREIRQRTSGARIDNPFERLAAGLVEVL